MPRWSLLFACLALAACGEPTPQEPGAKDTPLSASQLAEALRSGRPQDAAALEAALEESRKSLEGRLGGNLNDVAHKAKALSERPLTAEDIERFLAVSPKVLTVRGSGANLPAVLAENGLSVPEWSVLMARLVKAGAALRRPGTALSAQAAADLEAVRPFADRLDAAFKSR